MVNKSLIFKVTIFIIIFFNQNLLNRGFLIQISLIPPIPPIANPFKLPYVIPGAGIPKCGIAGGTYCEIGGTPILIGPWFNCILLNSQDLLLLRIKVNVLVPAK